MQCNYDSFCNAYNDMVSQSYGIYDAYMKQVKTCGRFGSNH